ncbi:Na+/H+ antiporter subunit D [Amorphus sp. 3PC139-8]|uniref:Na+/H+ antiporter subunit D n=1 Tax=Amorphus sp. 3PC139-8 TaxID=2735676 RepID=UPI00345DC903
MIIEPLAAVDWLAIAPVALPLAGGALCLMLRSRNDYASRLTIIVLGLLVLINVGLLGVVLNHGPVVMAMGNWLPPFGILFTVDVLGALLSLTTSVVGLVGAIYAGADIDVGRRRFGFYTFYLLLISGVSGAFLTGDIFNLYVWFEVLLIASFGLMILGGERAQLDGAVKYGVLNLVATTFFLIAVGLLYGLVGTLNMADIARSVPELADTAPIAAVATLFFVAFAMKAAAFPLNFWLPASYHTPRIVVSAVFAGLLTKVGVYALLRVLVMLLPESRMGLDHVFLWVAILTMLVGAFGALAQGDVRRLLGFVVITGIGTMLVGVAVGTEEALAGAVYYAIHSILVMTALYLAVGGMERLAGSCSLHTTSGLYRTDPTFAAIFLILAFAVSGLPPFSGFWPKVMLVRASVASGSEWAAATILFTGLLTTIAMARVWLLAFWRDLGTEAPIRVAGLPTASRVNWLGPIAILTVIVIALGVVPEGLMSATMKSADALLDPAGYVGVVLGQGEQP